MKKTLLSLLCCIMTIICVNAQNKTQLATDLRHTMDDFMAELSYANEDKDNFAQNLQNISGTFGSSEYFIYNGKQTESFYHWISSYCSNTLKAQPVSHTLVIQENTIAKVKPADTQDMRYTFNAVLKRETMEGKMPDIMTGWVVVWQGENQYLTIVEYHDNVKAPLPVILGEVNTGRDEFQITITKVRKQNTQVYIDMMLENTGEEDIIIDQSVYESRLVAYDDKGNKYDKIDISIGDNSWMGKGLGAGNSRRKLMAGVPVKARIRIDKVKPEAGFIRHMNWHLSSKEWDMTVNQPVQFTSLAFNGKPISISDPMTDLPSIGKVITGIRDFRINVTAVRRQGTDLYIDMMLLNAGQGDVIIDQAYTGAGQVAFDNLGNQYKNISIYIGDGYWMGCGSGAGASAKKLVAGVPLKACVRITGFKANAQAVRRMDWHFHCKEWNVTIQRPVKFMNLNIAE